jgi:hypothetical protein
MQLMLGSYRQLRKQQLSLSKGKPSQHRQQQHGEQGQVPQEQQLEEK